MKYIRKFTALILAIIFCVALVVGVGIIFSVKNVNVTYLDYSGTHSRALTESVENLNELKGTQLVFLDEESVREKLTDDGVIAVESVQKIFPATVNIVLRERMECFVWEAGQSYNVYDDRGALMRSVGKEYGIPFNSIDGSPNVVLNAEEDLIPELAAFLGHFKDKFGALRSLVEEVTVHYGVDAAIIELRSGLTFTVSAWREGGETKAERAFQIYSALSDAERTKGVYAVS